MSYHCPLCRQTFSDDGFSDYLKHMESEIVDQIKKDHPLWKERDGSCQKCYDYYKGQIRGESFKKGRRK